MADRMETKQSSYSFTSSTKNKSVLEDEYNFYQKQRNKYLKKYDGKVLLIKGEKLVGIFQSVKEAYEKGLDLFGFVPMFIQEIPDDEAIKERFAKHLFFELK